MASVLRQTQDEARTHMYQRFKRSALEKGWKKQDLEMILDLLSALDEESRPAPLISDSRFRHAQPTVAFR